MTLRLRIAAVASIAVALAVLVAAVSTYVAVRSDLRGQIDESLDQRAQAFVPPPPAAGPGATANGHYAGGAPQRAPNPARGPAAAIVGITGAGAGGPYRGHGGPAGPAGYGGPHGYTGFPSAVAPAEFGAASGYVQFISARGTIDVPSGQGSSPAIAPSAAERAIAARGHGRSLSDRTVNGTDLRVLTAGIGAQGAVMIARPLTEVNHELSRILLILLLVGLAGIGIAAVLGALVARTALTPIVRFTRRTEMLTGNLDTTQRLEVSGRDELARLAASFNATLDALAQSLQAQRHLVADASHELRTPISSLRANIQMLGDAERLPAEDQESLRRDIIEELDELTALVSDVVELARGTRSESIRDDVPLDQIVADAADRTRRRGDLRFELELEPTLVRGESDRIARAVSNMLENARRWSPPGGLIEVTLRDGVLTVRDHGPGFQEADLPKVFERFYRAEGARKLPGSGLGLAIVRQAAEAHQGYASADNAPGGGARVRVSFGPPLEVAPIADPAVPAAGPAET